ncbi:MAG TPA: serine hydrolase domain-containing protein [Pyrinomonadaceae bacterium]|nr:serine hydrolase domain-containing protein [Pyrinomonadaceae bacterium]
MKVPTCLAMLLVAIMALVCFGELNARPAKGESTGGQEFQAAFDKYVHDDSIVGAAYVLVKDGRESEWHSVGMADREGNQPVDRNTIFHWGSITKTLTAVAVMQLRDQHKISLDDSITKYVPELNRIHSDYGPVSQVTLRQLLSHTAGFQGPTWPYRDEQKPWQPFEPTEWAQLVAMMPYQELAFKPGSKFSYSNPAFIYLARVIEKVSGLPYQTYIQRNLLTPLGMTHSYFNLTPAGLAKDRSNNYSVYVDASGKETVNANGREFDTGITTPNGGLNAPLGDLVRWVAFLTGKNSPAARPILARTTLAEMWQPVVAANKSADRPEFMGLSFFLTPRGPVTFIGHIGSQAGFRAIMEFNSKTGAAIIAAFNTSHESVHNEAEKKAARKSEIGLGLLREQSFSLLD